MKYLSVFLGCLLSSLCFSQNYGRCLGASHYTKDKVVGNDLKEQKIYKPCSVCFTDDICSFYTPEDGVVTFWIEQPKSPPEPDSNGSMREDFISAEDNRYPKGWFSVDVYYGNPISVIISFTRSGEAIMLESNHWEGDRESDYGTKATFTSIKTYKATKAHIDSIHSGLAYDAGYIYNYDTIQEKPYYKNEGCFNKYLATEYYKDLHWYIGNLANTPNFKYPSDTGIIVFNMTINSLGKMTNIYFDFKYQNELAAGNLQNILNMKKDSILFIPGKVQNKAVATKGRFIISLPYDTLNYYCK